ncbi:unnamed protein product [Prorocentrum cordatum]|uniref:Uncharacterized protein n=1 Tax=Prorocentrum cordatum TaxID=2364126 RepID=A0ABN9VD11_9DINO|nr:unnamed protein product [Polarella glacialis]
MHWREVVPVSVAPLATRVASRPRPQLVMELPFTVARHASVPAATWGRKRRALAAISPVFSVLLLRLSFQGWGTFSASWCGVPAWLCCVSLGLVASAGVLLGSSEARQPPWHSLLLLQAFVCAIWKRKNHIK